MAAFVLLFHFQAVGDVIQKWSLFLESNFSMLIHIETQMENSQPVSVNVLTCQGLLGFSWLRQGLWQFDHT